MGSTIKTALERYLRGWNAAREELDEVPSLDDDIWIIRLACGADCHGTFNNIQLAANADFLERSSDGWP